MKRGTAFRSARRLGLMIGGEAAQSGLHFALNIALIKSLSARDYGVFAIVMVIGGIGLTYIRSLTAMPASIYIGKSRSLERANFYEGAFGAAAILLSSLIALIVAGLLSAWTPSSALAGAAFVGLWCLRSHLRTVHFAFGRQRIATLGDLAFALSGASLAGLAAWVGDDLMTRVFFALAAANFIGAATMRVLSREPIDARFDRSARIFYRRLLGRLGWSAFSVTTANLQGQGISLLVTALAGPAAYAPIAAMLIVFVPLRIIGAALVNLIQPEIARLAANADVQAVWTLAMTWTFASALAGLGYGVAAMAFLPFLKSQSLVGAPIYLLGAFAWSIYTLTLLYLAPRVILEVLMKFRSVAVITATAAALSMGAITLILEFAPASWALAGASVGEAVVLALAWCAATRELRKLAARRPMDADEKQREWRPPMRMTARS